MSEQQTVRYSKFWERVGAALTDSVIMGFPIMVLYVWSDTGITNNGFYWIFGILYFVLLEGPAGKGQTLGKKLFGLRVLSKEGHVLSYAQSFKRYFILSILPGLASLIGFRYIGMLGVAGWMAFALQQLSTVYMVMDIVVMASDRQKRSLHDYLSATIVLKTRAIVPETWPSNLEPLVPSFPWKREAPVLLLSALFLGMLLAINIGLRQFSARRPEYSYSQTLVPTGVVVEGVRLQGDRIELDVVMPPFPFMGAVSRRPERVSHRLEFATHRLIAQRLIDPSSVHQVIYWVRTSRRSKSGPSDRWIVDTQTLSAALDSGVPQTVPSVTPN